MSVSAGIKAIQEGKLDVMKTQITSALMEKAIVKLEEKKIEIAKTFLGSN